MGRFRQYLKQRKAGPNGAQIQEHGESRTPTPPHPPQSLHANTDSSVSESPPIPSFPDGVKVLHDCPDATVDICFIHGLTGDRESTWTAHGKPAPWPKTLLPPKLD